ncbi:MAG: helix-turn-helix domain-containing protein [Proteobacteria bacterium]|nr:helix-turn-helix domain-containing protein [Pseudomonadota bacterium]
MDRLARIERRQAQMLDLVETIRRAMPAVLLPVKQAADILQVSEGTVRRWLKAGDLPYVKVGRVVRVDLSRLCRSETGRIDRPPF